MTKTNKSNSPKPKTTFANPISPTSAAHPSLEALKEEASRCQACSLWANATQTVFGEGPTTSAIVFIGEVPGNDEDLAGRPFVGPAGQLFDEVLEEVGLDRESVYVTNTVKHFKWEPAAKRRLHKKPSAREAAACRPWLDAEIKAINPRIIVCLGATAAQAILGRDFRVTAQRGEPLPSALAPIVIATVHPASILRTPGPEDRHKAREAFKRDLSVVAFLARDHDHKKR
ncbi:MAG TPA: UdgX family uracil-DNA binding protein [Candidatus Limnocylindria bacterium]|jgi:DNA polymerase|nr:UdgX family uracil-DNA binding protein [Candidatus Limnocylindria bacterium]